eukprot:12753934-Alexandrium_andersonii.AAC.1
MPPARAGSAFRGCRGGGRHLGGGSPPERGGAGNRLKRLNNAENCTMSCCPSAVVHVAEPEPEVLCGKSGEAAALPPSQARC